VWLETSDGVFPDDGFAKERGGEIMGGWYNAKSMDERCQVLDEIGASCECKKECSHLQDLDWEFRDIECAKEEVWKEWLGEYREQPNEMKEKEFKPEPSSEV
jgi:hypothetical protein